MGKEKKNMDKGKNRIKKGVKAMTKKQTEQFNKNHKKIYQLHLKGKITIKEAMKAESFLCQYPDWEGGLIKGKHLFGKDGFCIICGEQK